MDAKMRKEIEEYEAAGVNVVATKNGKLTHVTGGITQDAKYCDSCTFLTFEPDPNPYDWFRDEDQKAVCTQMKATIEGSLETPSEMVNIQKPLWCPKLERELTTEERKIAARRLAIAKEH